MIAAFVCLLASSSNLIENSGFEKISGDKIPVGFALQGSVKRRYAGYVDEISTYGVALEPKPGTSGSVSQTVQNIDPSKGKWMYFTFRGRAEEDFKVSNNQLFIKFDFYAGSKYLDSATRLVYKLVEQDRADFTINGNHGKRGATVWRTYDFEELLPFKECDSVKISVGFKDGAATAQKNFDFLMDDWNLVQNQESVMGKVDPSTKALPGPKSVKVDRSQLVPLGGRWFARKVNGMVASEFNFKNADDLLYDGGELVAPFSGSMDSWLREGHMDQSGQVVKEDRYLPDNLVIKIEDGAMVFKTKNIPNHPTAIFPDRYGSQGYNPSFIKEQNMTFRLPLDPKLNPNAVAMTQGNANRALNMGPIGLAINGVVFFNPFDIGMQDASSIMDRCCGHPAPDFAYHYHKYPICVNTPFVDRGEKHSGILGFGLDGFPVYGPYEGNGEMAKNLKSNPLNAFNAHQDRERGWHYHVTPGKFPYILGGYMGTFNGRRRG